ncbi:MAG: MFS transporter [Gemmatimonadota bacterium]
MSRGGTGRGAGGFRARLRDLPPTVRGLGLVSFFNDLSSEMIYPLLPTFLVRVLGAGIPGLALIEGAAESANSLVKLVSGRISDRFGRRKPLVAAGYALAAATRPLLAVSAAPWHVLGLRVADRIGKGVRTAPRDALLAEATPAGSRGLGFAVQRSLDHAGALAGPLVAGALLAAFGVDLRLLFALAAIPAAGALVVLARVVREQVPSASGPPRRAAARSVVMARDLRWLLGTFFVFTLGNSTDAFLLLRAENLGVPVVSLPFLWAAFHASKALLSAPGGDLADRVGARPAIGLGWGIYALVYVGFAVATEAWHVWLLFLAYGAYFGLAEGPEKALVSRMAGEGAMGAAMGAYQLAIGIGALPASLLFAFVWHGYGPPAAFTLGAGIASLAVLFLFLGGRRPPA